MTNLKNYSSEDSRPFEKIQKMLAAHHAKKIVLDYDADGKVNEIMFTLVINGIEHGVKLPARIKNVEQILYPNKPELTEAQKKQAYITAWANIRDWIAAQMAMIDTQMVQPQEVFLPYLVNAQGQTLYEVMEKSQFALPG